MCVETGLSRALALNSACVAKIALFRYFKKNVRVKGLMIALRLAQILYQSFLMC